MTRTITITRANVRKEKGGAFVTNYEYIMEDDLGRKSEGNGSIAVSQQDAIEPQVTVNLQRKLGYKSFHVKHPPEGYLTGEQIAAAQVIPEKRGPGRPRINPVP